MDEEEDTPPEALPGHAADLGGTDVADVLLALTGEVAKLTVVLHELDDASFSKVRPRLKVFTDMVEQLPKDPVKRAARIRVIGFAPTSKPRGRRKKP